MIITGVKNIDDIILNMKWHSEHYDKNKKVLKEFMKKKDSIIDNRYNSYYNDIRRNYILKKNFFLPHTFENVTLNIRNGKIYLKHETF